MVTAMSRYYAFTPFLAFDGTNGADLATAFNDSAMYLYTGGCVASLISQTAGVAVVRFTVPGVSFDITLTAGDLIPINTTPYPIPASSLANSQTALGGVSSSTKYGGFGQALLGGLTVGSTNIAVTIKPAQPDTGFVASAFLDGPALSLGTITLGTPVKTSATVVTVPVTNSGLLPVTLTSSVVSVSVTAPQQ